MKPLFYLLLLLPLLSAAQVEEDFSDGDFLNNPQWSGTTEKFIVNNDFQLQLHDTAAGTAWLSTRNNLLKKTEWYCTVRFSFSPSGNNWGRIYLASDTGDFSGAVDGYFIQLGEAGSGDAIELFRQQGETVTSVCRGTDGLIASSFKLGIKVTRDENGHWRLFADPSGGTAYQPQAEGDDAALTNTDYFGFYCNYTKSNSTKFYFDNIIIREMTVDTLPPQVTSVLAPDDTTVVVSFNEALDKTTAETTDNYLLNNGVHPGAALLLPSGNSVRLLFNTPFQQDLTYTLTLQNIKDVSGNGMETETYSFIYHKVIPGDVVINEIMADPSPPVQLPEFEYLELFNRTSYPVSLSGWKLIIGTTEKDFEQVTLQENGYLIVGKDAAAADFAPYGSFYGFGSFSLKNSGQTLVLKNGEGTVIYQVGYDKSWYRDKEKEEGGWSLEMINPDDLCSEGNNWKASESPSGGTPGSENSVYAHSYPSPAVRSLEIPADNILRLRFTQKMNEETLGNKENYTVSNGIGTPKYVYTFEEEPDKTELYFEDPFQEGTAYRLTLSARLKNCMGIAMVGDTSIIFGLPAKAEKGDVIINEVLFNPVGDGVDYVELYNRSGKIIDLSQLWLGSVTGEYPNPPDTTFYQISGSQLLYPQGEYRLLSVNSQKVMEQYETENPDAFLEMEHFPSYPNESGTVLLMNGDDTLVDCFHYSESMHYPLLQYVDGVSLERISFDKATDDPSNWHSASETSGFGTPGYKNSQATGDTDTSHVEISIEPEIFSPDNDGYNDVTAIKYRFTDPGIALSVFIFDKNGNLIKILAENKYPGTAEGSLIWDGITEENIKAPVGIYMVYIRTVNLDGQVKVVKKTVVVASKL